MVFWHHGFICNGIPILMSDEQITIRSYEQQWPTQFNLEKKRLLPVIKPWLVGTVEHVGSTAVFGLSAKPVIDIMVGIKSLGDSKEVINALVSNGYCYSSYKSDFMYWFCKPSAKIRTHHLHCIPFNSALWHQRIKFRDALRTSPEIASEYQALKIRLAKQYPRDREKYTQGKWPFIKKVLAL